MDKIDFKQAIVLKAREILSSNGYKKTTTEDIAKSLNKTKSALYYYFKNREEILKEVLKYEAEEVKKLIIEEIEKESEPVNKLRSFFITRFNIVNQVLDFYRPVINEYFMHNTFVLDALNGYPNEEYQIFISVLKEGEGQNLFKQGTTEQKAQSIFKGMRGFDFYLFQGEDFNTSLNEMLSCLNLIVKGILVKEKEIDDQFNIIQ